MPDMLPIYRNWFMLVDYYRKKGKLVHLGITPEEVDRRMLRTCGDTICEECGKKHYDHPLIDDVMDETGDRLRPFLHIICDGTIAKL
jgi:hypothetical protein